MSVRTVLVCTCAEAFPFEAEDETGNAAAHLAANPTHGLTSRMEAA